MLSIKNLEQELKEKVKELEELENKKAEIIKYVAFIKKTIKELKGVKIND